MSLLEKALKRALALDCPFDARSYERWKHANGLK
jgi:hypothetical protein